MLLKGKIGIYLEKHISHLKLEVRSKKLSKFSPFSLSWTKGEVNGVKYLYSTTISLSLTVSP